MTHHTWMVGGGDGMVSMTFQNANPASLRFQNALACKLCLQLQLMH